jgi:superfamily II DNA or RNA helicase
MVNIHYGDSYSLVEPEVPVEIEKMLTYWHKRIEFDERTMKKVAAGETKRLYRVTESIDPDTQTLIKTLVTLPGFAVPLRQKLAELGHEVTVIDERTPRPRYDMVAGMKGLREYQYRAAYDAIYAGGGVLHCPTGYGKTALAGAIIHAHPREDLCARNTPTVMVVTPGKDLARKNWQDLHQFCQGREVGMVGGGVDKFSEDVVIITPESLKNIPDATMNDVGILIYDEVHTLSEVRATTVMRAKRALRYGLSATPSGRFDNADKVITGVFGPVVFQCTYAEAIEVGAVVPIRVYWLGCPEPGSARPYKTRDAIYRNMQHRNGKFHQLVRALFDRVPADRQLLAVVDRLDHMNSLIPHLNGSTVMVHATSTQKSLDEHSQHNLAPIKSKEREAIYDQMAAGELKRVVSSGIYRQGVNFPQLSVLVNLAGMKSEIIAGQLPGRASRSIEGKDYAFIVDFWHDWDKEEIKGKWQAGYLLRDDMARETVYKEMGFDQVWIDSLDQLEI